MLPRCAKWGNRLFAASVSPLTANDAGSNGAIDHLAPGPLMRRPVVDQRGLRLVDYPRPAELFCDEMCEHGLAFTVRADTAGGLAAELRKILQKLGLADVVRVELSGIGVPAARLLTTIPHLTRRRTRNM